MKLVCLVLSFLSFGSCFSQETISRSYDKLLNDKANSGEEYLLPTDFCFRSPMVEKECPFCNCNSLDSLKTILSKNLNLKIEIISNSDYRGSTKANLKWSKNLSESIKSYLMKNGIDEKRLKATGVGESNPYKFINDVVVDNTTIKAGTIANETYCNSIASKETKEKVISLSKRIIIKVL